MGSSWEHLGGFWESFWEHSGSPEAFRGLSRSSKRLVESSRVYIERSRVPLGAFLGASWAVLEASWGLLAAKTHQKRGGSVFWRPLGAVLASFLECLLDIFVERKFNTFIILSIKTPTCRKAKKVLFV